MKRKLLSILLCLVLALSLLPTAALAEEAVEGGGTEGSGQTNYVAQINETEYETLQAAIAAAAKNATVTLLADTRENVTIGKAMTLDLNGHTLNGSTGERKPALTITARVTVKDSSEAQTGTIMREDTAKNSGVSSHYVIDIQGDGWLTFESGTVKNGSGAGGTKGASLVRVGDDSVAEYPGLNIKGGTFTQDNFIVIKVDRGYLTLNGGTLNSANSYAVENWFRATIKGGTANGAVSSWTYSGGSNSTLEISGGTVNGAVTSVNYGDADKVAKVEITGGTVTGELDTRSYDPTTGKLTSITDVAKSTIKVTGGTFSDNPSAYLVEGSTATQNDDGTFGVAKAYLAKVGGTSYYTMDEAFKAQTASGEPIVLLRDYTTGSTFNSGSINRTVDLNGHTWTCTGTDASSAAFEINYPNASLTVKNGTIVSSQLVGLIPTASSLDGPITYDNSSLTFDGVEMTTTATSGIETNGNNTNDNVTLRNSTLNVPNGFGIYFPSSGTLTIDNSTINAKTMGVQVCAGSLNINEGSAITVSGDAVPKTEGDGAIQDGAAISIVNRTGYKGLGDITVTGGTFTAKSGNVAIKAYDWQNQGESNFTASDKVSVSGGTFNSEVPGNCCAPGFEPTQNKDGTYGVKITANLAAEVLDAQGNTVGAYDTLTAAITAAQNGDTIKLLKDVPDGDGVIVPSGKNFTLDFANHTYTVTQNLAGSTGTESQCFQLLKDSTLTFKNGTIKANNGNVAMIIQNYSNLTLENMLLDGESITRNDVIIYTMSNNCGNVVIKDTTINTVSNGVAFDVYGGFGAYSDVTVTVTGSSEINGKIEVDRDSGTQNKNTLAINGGTINGALVFTDHDKTAITISGGNFSQSVNKKYLDPSLNAELKRASGKTPYSYYTSVAAATAAAQPGDTVTDLNATTEQKVTLTLKYNDGATADTTYNVASGTSITLPTPAYRSGYTFNGWYDGSKFYAAGASYTVSATVTLNAFWSYISSGSGSYVPTYSVSTPSKTENGSVTVSPKSASKGDTVTVTVKPDSGYVLETLTVTDKNGNELTLKDKGNGKYTFTMPAGKVEVKATFMEDNSMLNFFYDVPNNAYFYEAVKWAVKNGITDGVGDNLFAPEQPCTRAQIVTFLWRAAGSPEPKGAASGMTDVVSGSYYEKAVAWAIENGITTGTTTSTFSPDATCTRAQAVTFLARALKAKAASAAEFSDVPNDSYFADAVAWAAANGVTEGIGGGLFGSDNDCTRGQIVTFLYRAYNK